MSPKLKVATTGTDSDFVVKLIDVYPGDYLDDSKVNETRRPMAKPEDFKKATERVWHSKEAASGVEVLVLPQ